MAKKTTTIPTTTIKSSALGSLFKGTLIGLGWSAFVYFFSSYFVHDPMEFRLISIADQIQISLIILSFFVVASALVVWFIDSRARKSAREAQFR